MKLGCQHRCATRQRPLVCAEQKELPQSPCAQDLAIEQLCPTCAHASVSKGAFLSSALVQSSLYCCCLCLNSLCYLIQELHLIER